MIAFADSFLQDPDFIDALYILAVILFIVGLRGLAGPQTAVRGNKIAAVGMAIAVIATLLKPGVIPDTETAILMAFADVASVIVYFAVQSDPRHSLAVDLFLRGGVIASALGWGLFAGARRRMGAPHAVVAMSQRLPARRRRRA